MCPGDEVRSIDWNVTARMGQPFVKRYVEERQLTLMLMADISASQDFGSGGKSKREAAAELCALLAFSATCNDDKVGLTLFHGKIEQYIPARKGQKHSLRVVREVLTHDSRVDKPQQAGRQGNGRLGRWLPWGRRRSWWRSGRQSTDIAGAVEFLMSVSKRKTVCFVVSDFFDEDYVRSLQMAARKHDVIAVLITDPREMELPNVGLVSLQDPESGQIVDCDTGSSRFRQSFAEQAQQRIGELRSAFRGANIDFCAYRCFGVDRGSLSPLLPNARAEESPMNSLATVGLGAGIWLVAASAWSADGEAAPGAAEENVQRVGPVTVITALNPPAPRIGDEITLEIRVEAEAQVEVLMPEFGEALERYTIIDFVPRQNIAADGSSTYRQRYTLQPIQSGPQSIPPILVEFVDRRPGQNPAPEDFDAYEVLTERIDFTVESVVPVESAGELRPPLGPLELQRRSTTARNWSLAIGLVVLVAVAAIIVAARRVQNRAVRRNAYELARGKLDRLLQDRSSAAPRLTVEQFYVEISAIIRRYLEDRYAVKAPELTTDEFLQLAAGESELTREHQQLLSEFLQQADVVKFAAVLATDAQVQRSSDLAMRFLEETREKCARCRRSVWIGSAVCSRGSRPCLNGSCVIRGSCCSRPRRSGCTGWPHAPIRH